MQTVIFNGYKYYKQKTGYYQMAETNKRKQLGIERRLHRAIWKFYNGDIPKGYQVHHKDENKDNNDISNLELLSASEHAKLHSCRAKVWWHTTKGKKANKKGIRNAKAWHSSEEGYKWHSEHQKETIKKMIIEETCLECGNAFTTFKDKRHQVICRKCRDKLLKRELRKQNPEKYRKQYQCILRSNHF